MQKVLKWIGIMLGGLIGILLLASMVLYAKTKIEFARTYDVTVDTINIPSDADSIARGKHLAGFLCAECHGANLGGVNNWVDLPSLVTVSTPNITPGMGSPTASFSDQDWVRIMRHGVKPDGTSVFIMPSQFFYYLSDQDLGDILAYVKSVPALDSDEAMMMDHVQVSFLGSVMYGAGLFGDLIPADNINQSQRPSSFPEVGVTPEYGEYLVNINGCRDCHGSQLAGGKPGDPNSPLAPNLTPGGELAAWTDADFTETIRTGVTPFGHTLNPRYMPWDYKRSMTDAELKAIFVYLQSLPKLQSSTTPSQ